MSRIYKQAIVLMFRTSFFTVVIMFIACISVSCGRNTKATTDNLGMEIDSITVDTAVSLGNETNAPTCKINLSIKYFKGGKHARMINDTLLRNGVLTPDYLSLSNESLSPVHAVDSFVRRFLSDYREEYGRMYRSDREHAASYNYEYTVKTDVRSNGEDIMTYIASVYINGGGTQGTHQTLALNFNVKTGKMLRLSDIFVPGHEQGLKEAIVEQLYDDYDADNIEELNEKTIFANIDIYAPENFIIGEDDITFIYCENEIACRDMGEIRVTIPISDLKKLIRKDYE